MIEIGPDWLAAHPVPDPGQDTDKNDRGRLLIAGGSRRVPGALRLVGEAALRAGAGKVQLATVEAACLGLGLSFPEAGVFGLPPNREGELGAEAASPLIDLMERCDAFVLGPGMGQSADPDILLEAVLAANAPAALVLDAAMIAAVPGHEGAIARLPKPVILTPHPGEMAKLLECDEADVSLAAARDLAGRLNAVIVLKGADTWIVAPDRTPLHYAGGGPGLATAGSGDVLAGLAGGLAARGADPVIAAAWAVWLHGEAGKCLARSVGPLGFLARELPALIPRLMAVPKGAAPAAPAQLHGH